MSWYWKSYLKHFKENKLQHFSKLEIHIKMQRKLYLLRLGIKQRSDTVGRTLQV